MERYLLEIAFPTIFAIIVSLFIHPKLVKVARLKSIVDNPDARRLNKEPVPALGGLGIFIGIMFSVCLFSCLKGFEPSFGLFSAMVMMLFIGIVDDMFDLRARVKFVVQILAVALVVYLGGFRIDNLHGLWGIYALPEWLAVSLTFLTGVGVINAINLMDGVDGLCSGYGIITSVICGSIFYQVGDTEFAIICFAAAGSLLPFFVQNMFGRKYKMFMGDGGSLVLGLLFAVIIMQFIHTGGLPRMKGVVSFMVAVFSVPVFDTLRVMVARMLRGKCPFSPDKTHLHHVFINMGYHHPASTAIILCLDLFIVGVWFVTERMTAITVDAQFYIVVAVGVVSNLVIYCGAAFYRSRCPERYAAMRKRISEGQIKQGVSLRKLQRALDRI